MLTLENLPEDPGRQLAEAATRRRRMGMTGRPLTTYTPAEGIPIFAIPHAADCLEIRWRRPDLAGRIRKLKRLTRFSGRDTVLGSEEKAAYVEACGMEPSLAKDLVAWRRSNPTTDITGYGRSYAAAASPSVPPRASDADRSSSSPTEQEQPR